MRSRPGLGRAYLRVFPFERHRILQFESQSSFWQPRPWLPNWPVLQRRLGGRVAQVVEIETLRRPHGCLQSPPGEPFRLRSHGAGGRDARRRSKVPEGCAGRDRGRPEHALPSRQVRRTIKERKVSRVALETSTRRRSGSAGWIGFSCGDLRSARMQRSITERRGPTIIRSR